MEGYTEGEATKDSGYDPNCLYNLKEVPIAKRFDALIENRTALSGTTISTIEAFDNMEEK